MSIGVMRTLSTSTRACLSPSCAVVMLVSTLSPSPVTSCDGESSADASCVVDLQAVTDLVMAVPRSRPRLFFLLQPRNMV